MDQETANRLFQLLRDAASQVGLASDYAWPQIVRYTWTQALVTVTIQLVALVALWTACGFIGRAAYRALEAQGGPSKGSEMTDTDAGALAAVVIVVCAALLTYCVLCSLAYWLPILLAPEGAALLQLLSRK